MIPIIDQILGSFSQDLGVDLGTVNTLVYVKGKGIVIREPSIVAQHKKTKKVLAIGSEAKKMLGKTPANIICVRPLKEGVISDYDTTLTMLSHFIKKIHERPGRGISLPRPRIIIGIPSQISEVEKRALLNVAAASGAREAYLVEEPIAAAIGANLPIFEPVGSMIVDIGGGTCEIAVISLGGIVCGRSLKIGGDTIDLDIIAYVRSRWGISLGEKTAEDIKITLGSAYPAQVEKEMVVRGLDLEKGLPKSIKILSSQVREALAPSINVIVGAIKDVIHDAPPDLVSDIAERGIVLCGGGAAIGGLAKLISQETKMPVSVDGDPLFTVTRGCAALVDNFDLLARVKFIKSG